MDNTSNNYNENAVTGLALVAEESKTVSADVATLTKEGVHNVTKIGKSWAGMLAQCNADALEAWKKTPWFFPPGPAMFLDILGQGLLACVEAQKSMLDFIDVHTDIATNLGTELQQSVERDMVEQATFAADSFTRGMDLVIGAEKGMLEIATMPLRSTAANSQTAAAEAA